jgi:twitching motility protein PilT
MIDLKGLLTQTVDAGASDLHLVVDVPPMIRVDGRLMPASKTPITRAETRVAIYSLLNDEQRAKFERDWELDFSVQLETIGRFRVNVHKEKGNVEAAFRAIPTKILTIEELGLPPVVAAFARRSSGLVLVTGPTGMGKTTTLAAMLDLISRERNCLIITIEDPIEYVLQHHKGVVKQREIAADTHSFPIALRQCLRQDPDVICIGEMRDLETISTAAETGHLVLATLHTPDAAQTIDRIIDVFPPYQQDQVRIQLASSLQAIVAQQLIPKVSGGRIVAIEILSATPAVRNVIRTQKTEQIATLLQTSGEFGMQAMDKSLQTLYERGLITYDEAVSRATDPRGFVKTLSEGAQKTPQR